MARTCTICVHANRAAIDEALVAGVPQRTIAERWSVSKAAVQRHAKRHLSPSLAAMQAEREHEGAVSLLDRVEELIGRTETLLQAAESDGRVSTALAAVRELRSLLELLGRASGELNERPQVTVNLMTSEEWLQVRAALFAALAPYPEARTAVSGRLLELEAGGET